MGITGNLKTMQLGELFQWLSLGSKTGTLLIDGHGVEKRIYFQDGRIASTSSSDQREYLGHFLVSNGFITEEELKMAMEVQEESQILLGKILVMINAIAEADLLRLMRKKAEESIYDVFLWTEGSFEFVDGEMPDQKMVPLSLDVTGIIMEGMRRYDEWQLIRQRVPDSSVVPDIVRPLDMDSVGDREKLIVPYIDGQRSIEEIALQTHNAEFVVSKLISEGLRTGTMRLSEKRPQRPAAPLSRRARARSTTSSSAGGRSSRTTPTPPTACSRPLMSSTRATAARPRPSARPSERSRPPSTRTGSPERRSRSWRSRWHR